MRMDRIGPGNSNTSPAGLASCWNGVDIYVYFDFPTEMREIPTPGVGGNWNCFSQATVHTISAYAGSRFVSKTSGTLYFTVNTTTAGYAAWIETAADPAAYIEFDSEL